MAGIYRWVDPEGNVHFDARPRPGAEQVEVRPQVVERDDATRERQARTERFSTRAGRSGRRPTRLPVPGRHSVNSNATSCVSDWRDCLMVAATLVPMQRVSASTTVMRK